MKGGHLKCRGTADYGGKPTHRLSGQHVRFNFAALLRKGRTRRNKGGGPPCRRALTRNGRTARTQSSVVALPVHAGADRPANQQVARTNQARFDGTANLGC